MAKKVAKKKRDKALPKSKPPQDGYDQKKVAENNKQREQATDARDIGAIPGCKNFKRKERCRDDFGVFLKTYFPEDTRHSWMQSS